MQDISRPLVNSKGIIAGTLHFKLAVSAPGKQSKTSPSSPQEEVASSPLSSDGTATTDPFVRPRSDTLQFGTESSSNRRSIPNRSQSQPLSSFADSSSSSFTDRTILSKITTSPRSDLSFPYLDPPIIEESIDSESTIQVSATPPAQSITSIHTANSDATLIEKDIPSPPVKTPDLRDKYNALAEEIKVLSLSAAVKNESLDSLGEAVESLSVLFQLFERLSQLNIVAFAVYCAVATAWKVNMVVQITPSH